MDVRNRLITATIELIRRNGVHGAGMSEILDRSKVARRSAYLNFPGGKEQLVYQSVRAAQDGMRPLLQQLVDAGDPGQVIEAFTAYWKHELQSSNFASGCPFTAAALSGGHFSSLQAVSAEAFREWQQIFATGLRKGGVPEPEADRLAMMVICAVEGAILVCQSQKSTTALDQVAEQLREMLGRALDRSA